MTHPAGEVGGATNDTVVAAEPTIEDRFAALGIDQADKETEEEAEQSADAPEGDTQAEPDLAEVEIDEADLPAIEPPVSLTAEEKEAFKTWPREAQEAITRRVGDLEKGLHAKAQEAKTAQAKIEQAAAERIAQANDVHLQTLKALLPEIPPRPDYRFQGQPGWGEAMEAHEAAIAQHRYVQQVAAKIEADNAAAESAATQRDAQENERVLREKLPEMFGDKGEELKASLRSTAVALGYSEDQLAHVDAIDVLAMKQASEWKAKADRYDTLMAKQMEKVRDAKKLPKVSRPGVPVGKGVIAGERYEADRQAMRRGDSDAAARVFAKFL